MRPIRFIRTTPVLTAVLICISIGGFAAGEDPAPRDEIAALQRQIGEQRRQIEALQQSLAAQQKMLDRLSDTSAQQRPLIASTSPMLPAGAAQQTRPEPKAPVNQAKTQVSPLSFRIGEADFTPGGFMDMTSTWRSTNVGGIGTGFAGIPFNNTAAGKTSESRFSAQNSRIALKITTKAGNTPVTGYLESDFLGNAPANLHVSSNADTLRMRLYWVQLRPGKWEVLAGQSWSMMTPGRTGISPVPSDIFITQNMDTNYQVGLVWTRAPQFRFVYHASPNVTAGLALENPQQYTTAGAVLPAFAASQVDPNGNSNAPNLHPDVQGKLAFDGKHAGRAFHLEFAGMVRSFKVLGPTLASTTTQGGAGSVNGVAEVVKNFRLIATTFYGRGGGRYIYGLGPDFIVTPSGALKTVKSASGIAGFEYQASPKAQLFAYYGTAYFGREYAQDAAGKYFGYGFSGSPLSNNRTIQEWTVGYTHTFWKNPNYGALQLINQYSYVYRTPWAVPAAGPLHAHTNMFYNNLRYTLP